MSRVGGKRRDYDGDTGTALSRANSVHAPVFFVRFRSRFSVRFSLLSFSRASVESASVRWGKRIVPQQFSRTKKQL